MADTSVSLSPANFSTSSSASAASSAASAVRGRNSTSSSILAKLRSPFSAKHRVLAEYYILPDDPYRRYAPGDLVKGAVVLSTSKPIRLTHLVVCLHGFVQLAKGGRGQKPGRQSPDRPPIAGADEGDGFLSIFRDEVVLCGQGGLEPGTYQFRFELEFPAKPLPSSLDFERGTISYTITSTLTRPTTVAATTACDRKIQLVETIDVGLVDVPKPQLVVAASRTRSHHHHRRHQRRPSLKLAGDNARELSQTPDADASSATTATPPGSRAGPVAALRREAHAADDDDAELPRSPAPSERSAESLVSGSSDSTPPSSSGHTGGHSKTKGGNVVLQDPLVTARLELSRGGCLPGDTLTLQVSVQHVKPIKSLQGVIVTFYRQSRIDASPLQLPLLEHAAGGNTRVTTITAATTAAAAAAASKDSYYAKSKTGLASLSSSAPGSSRQYRMDLCQTLVPLIVDPATLQATVRASIRVPDDIFPTIASVPGEMLSFRYFVEAALDLKGKLAGQDLSVTPLGQAPPLSSSSSSLPASAAASMAADGSLKGANAAGLSWTWAGSVVNTEKLRREKSLVVRVFEVTVGTRDSRRGRKRPNIIKSHHSHSSGGAGGADGRTGSNQRRRPMSNHGEPAYVGGSGGTVRPLPAVDIVGDGLLDGLPYLAPNPGTNNDHQLRQQQQLSSHHHYSSAINDPSFPASPPYPAQSNGGDATDAPQHQHQQQPACVPLPPPQHPLPARLAAEGEQEMDEKTRLRLAEERLLPSSPPAAASGLGPGSSSSSVAAGLPTAAAAAANTAASASASAIPAALLAPPPPAPSAPFVPDCGDVDSLFGSASGDDGFGTDDGAAAPQYGAAWFVPLAVHGQEGEEEGEGENVMEVGEEEEEREAEEEDMRAPLATTTMATAAATTTDDKQELERQRLLAMASAPASAAAHLQHAHSQPHNYQHHVPGNSAAAAAATEAYDGGRSDSDVGRAGYGAAVAAGGSAALWTPTAPLLPEEEEVVGGGGEGGGGRGGFREGEIGGGSGTGHMHSSSPPVSAPPPVSSSSSLHHPHPPPPLHPPRYGEQLT